MQRTQILLATLLLITVAANRQVRAELLFSQLDEGVGVGFGVTSNDFRLDILDIIDTQAADDFVVPAGELWHLTDAFVLGQHQEDVIPVERAHVFIYSNDGGKPGSLIYSRLDADVSSSTSSDFSVPLAVDLAAGTYWLSVQTAWPDVQDWIWSRREPATGFNGVWRNPLDGYGYGHTVWTDIPDLSFLSNDPDSSDLLFELRGSMTAVPEPSSLSLVAVSLAICLRRRARTNA